MNRLLSVLLRQWHHLSPINLVSELSVQRNDSEVSLWKLGPGFSKRGKDNPRLERNLNLDMKT